MQTDKSTFAAAEPPDGTKLILVIRDDWMVLVRDDETARKDGYPAGVRWYLANEDAGPEEPETLLGWLHYADAVYALGEQLAVFN
ncbi:hypothetical protein [Paractinoplanes toevensis]|uniref:Uncharacterized protein n=1 Tax=Paractinoplanes toevensis TaxID=571911 RepID=A0A919T527_9ACTN|nr:hypothetical protein [Actinoplanes toevensis]GIM88807.1 hypothetical protein Ato02nite_006000 [Actinoplanes toevensis]